MGVKYDAILGALREADADIDVSGIESKLDLLESGGVSFAVTSDTTVVPNTYTVELETALSSATFTLHDGAPGSQGPQGSAGPQGPEGPPGSVVVDSELSSESGNPVANSALAAAFSGLSGSFASYCTSEQVSADLALKADLTSSGGTIVASQLPAATSSTLGAVKTWTTRGIDISGSQVLYVVRATDNEITAREHAYKPIVPSNLNKAVTAALTDSKHITLTSAEQAVAQEVLGISGGGGGGADESLVKEIALIYG